MVFNFLTIKSADAYLLVTARRRFGPFRAIARIHGLSRTTLL